MFEKKLRAGETKTFKTDSLTHLCGLRSNGMPWSHAVNLVDFAYDGIQIGVRAGYDGKHKTWLYIDNENKSAFSITGQHATATESRARYIDMKLDGEFTIAFNTECGDERLDKRVSITIRPDHQKETVTVTYRIFAKH